MEPDNQRPGQVVHEANEGRRVGAQHLQQKSNRDQHVDEGDDPPDRLDGAGVVAALAVDRRPRGGHGRDRPYRLARRRLLSDDFAIVRISHD